MPAGDGSGPLGQGPLTGRGLGGCNTSNIGNFAKYGVGLGLGLGLGYGCRRGFARGIGRGFGRFLGFDGNVSKTQKELLTEQKEMLESRLNLISEQLEDL